jgi:hypothetical protein
MPVVKKTHGGRVVLRAIDERVTVGDTVDVSTEYAEYLVEDRGDFTRVDVTTVDYEETDNSADGDTSTDSDGDSTEFDAAAFVDRTPMDDVIEDIHAGEADGHLDDVAAEASRVGVEDAVGERRAELDTAGED